MKILKRGALILLGVIILASAWLWISATTSLDHDYDHTTATAALPEFGNGSARGLVRISANGMTFRARIRGFDNPAPNGDLLLLHGFPETSIMYQPLIDAAAAAGYRVVAPDQRGYSPGARPSGRANYAGTLLVGDALAIADAVGFDTFHLIGHDWGAGVGWQLVFGSPERLLSYTSLSIPHVAAFAAAIADDPDQQSRSAYMGFFALPWLAEQVFAMDDLGTLATLYAEHPASERDEYLRVFAEPGALTGALNWYRAGALESIAPTGNVTTPTLFIWGNQDPAVGRTAVEGQRQFIDGPLQEIELDTGHWLMATATDTVIAAVLAHVARFDNGPDGPGDPALDH